MANPNTRETLKQYIWNLEACNRNQSRDEQLEDRIDEALQYYVISLWWY